MACGEPRLRLDDFIKPLAIDANVVLRLSREFASTFRRLSAESLNQFLPTPVSESILRPVTGRKHGRFLAIDIGGTNLRVGFVELVANSKHDAPARQPKPNRLLERSWPIVEHLKNENSDLLFAWIGEHIAFVVREGVSTFGLDIDTPLPMGVTFSFPMEQHSLSGARVMRMGKGFKIDSSDLDLASLLLRGYAKHREKLSAPPLPRIEIAAIANDAVATLVSLAYQIDGEGQGYANAKKTPRRKAIMGLVVGTGSNATIPLQLRSLHPSKLPASIHVLPAAQGDDNGPGPSINDLRIVVNTEWTINGSAEPLRRLGLVTEWDARLDAAGEQPGFQPLEYVTAGRYLGELVRLVFLDYVEQAFGLMPGKFPPALGRRFGLTTAFISFFYPGSPKGEMLHLLEKEFPVGHCTDAGFQWTRGLADALFRIAKAIELRAAGIVAAATVGLLVCADELVFPLTACSERVRKCERDDGVAEAVETTELVVGYTGACIECFQDYLEDCQRFIDQIVCEEFAGEAPTSVRVVLSPCHDGGVIGAGILVPAALGSVGVS